MSVIQAVSRKCSTLVDGSLRIVIEISAVDALSAFTMFGQPDTPMAIARLTPEAAIKQAQHEMIAKDEAVYGISDGQVVSVTPPKPKVQLLSQWAALRCADPLFQRWVDTVFTCDIENPELRARAFVLQTCEIESRAELDSNPEAAAVFHKCVRAPFAEYIREFHEEETQ